MARTSCGHLHHKANQSIIVFQILRPNHVMVDFGDVDGVVER